MYVFGGSTGGAMEDFHQLNLETSTWSQVPTFAPNSPGVPSLERNSAGINNPDWNIYPNNNNYFGINGERNSLRNMNNYGNNDGIENGVQVQGPPLFNLVAQPLMSPGNRYCHIAGGSEYFSLKFSLYCLALCDSVLLNFNFNLILIFILTPFHSFPLLIHVIVLPLTPPPLPLLNVFLSPPFSLLDIQSNRMSASKGSFHLSLLYPSMLYRTLLSSLPLLLSRSFFSIISLLSSYPPFTFFQYRSFSLWHQFNTKDLCILSVGTMDQED